MGWPRQGAGRTSRTYFRDHQGNPQKCFWTRTIAKVSGIRAGHQLSDMPELKLKTSVEMKTSCWENSCLAAGGPPPQSPNISGMAAKKAVSINPKPNTRMPTEAMAH